ncbi:RPM1-interacting protein 4 [Tanacetum coccineum]|uniref:RPM1-interacting protein 4 n=1 Tax=Tanacetum coccineum TaxID=301880 RepID=A0ABQ5I719_9ASTR
MSSNKKRRSAAYQHAVTALFTVLDILVMEEKGRPLPKFGDWDVNDPASAEGFTVIFNKARDEKKTGGNPESPSNVNSGARNAAAPVKKPPAIIDLVEILVISSVDGPTSTVGYT